jgi:hypothetical protein
MKSLSVAFFFVASLTAYAQVVYQDAYIINENGEKITCLIKNLDWLSNPDKIQYKLSADGEVIEGLPSALKEFRVEGFPRYISATVDVDMSSVNFHDLSDNRNPMWEKKTIFLREVVPGKFGLYAWVNGNMKRFFFTVDGTAPQQLIYKEYHFDASRNYAANNMYQQQIYSYVKCEGASQSGMKALRYNEKVLEKYFWKVNVCHGAASETKAKVKVEQRRKLNLTITPGVTYSTMMMGIVGDPYRDVDLQDGLTPRLGLEAEFIFGFHRNKWSLFIEPSYHSYRDVASNRNRIDYAAIEFPVGLRHYFYFKNDFAAFVNGIIVPGRRMVFDEELRRDNINLEAGINTLFGAGAGLSKGRFKVEARMYGVTDLMGKYPMAYVEWRRSLIIAGFRIVKK